MIIAIMKIPIEVTLVGIVMDVKDEQLLKRYSAIHWTPRGTFALIREVQPMKAAVSINWTESGIVTVIRFLQSLKAQLPTDVAPKLMVIEVTEVHESKA